MGESGRVAEEERTRREGRKGRRDNSTAWDEWSRGDGGGGDENGFEKKGEGRRWR